MKLIAYVFIALQIKSTIKTTLLLNNRLCNFDIFYEIPTLIFTRETLLVKVMLTYRLNKVYLILHVR